MFAFFDDIYSSAPQSASPLFMVSSPLPSGIMPGSSSTTARPVFGTQQGRNRRSSLHSNQTPALPRAFGSGLGPCPPSSKGSSCSVRRSALRHLCTCGTGAAARMPSSSESPPSATCSRPGCCYFLRVDLRQLPPPYASSALHRRLLP